MAVMKPVGALDDILALGLCRIVANKPVAFLTITLILEPTIYGIGGQIGTELSALMLASSAFIDIQTARPIGTDYKSIVAVALARICLASKISTQLITSAITIAALVRCWRLARSTRGSMFAGTSDL
jgi:hypothetical protein